MTIELLKEKFNKIYAKDTCYPVCRDNWSENNPTLGHCAVVSLIVNDYFGGDLYKIKIDGVSHYFNFIDENIIDLTAAQFGKPIDYSGKIKKTRDEMLANEDTLMRYKLFKSRFQQIKEKEER